MQLLLIRHAESANNAVVEAGQPDRRIPDPHLSPLGYRQAEALAEWVVRGGSGEVPRPTRIFSSLMIRTIETATPLADALDLPIIARPDTFERRGMYNGSLTDPQPHPGRPHSEIQALTPRVQLPDTATENGWYDGDFENQVEGIRRALRLADWLRTFDKDEVVALVTHGDIGAMLLSAIMVPEGARAALDYDPREAQRHMTLWSDLENTSTSCLTIPSNSDPNADAAVRLRWINRVDHLVESDLAGQGNWCTNTDRWFYTTE